MLKQQPWAQGSACDQDHLLWLETHAYNGIMGDTHLGLELHVDVVCDWDAMCIESCNWATAPVTNLLELENMLIIGEYAAKHLVLISLSHLMYYSTFIQASRYMVIHSTNSNHQHHQRHSWAIGLGWYHSRHHPDICHLYPMYLNTSWWIHQHHSNTCQYSHNTCQYCFATCPLWNDTCHFPNVILDRPNRCHCDFLHVFLLVQTENIICYIPEFYTVPHQTSLLHPNQHCSLVKLFTLQYYKL
jgi:hypothetical protein